MLRCHLLPAVPAVMLLLGSLPAAAGVVNPNLSVIGQPYLRLTDDPADSDHDRVRMDVGETEIVLDDYLNPFTRGNITLALGADGIELEEGYFVITRGLPAGLNLKGGKYRAGFGKLNAEHPHTYPFFERFHVLAAYLPGVEALNETGLQLSARLPAPGEMSLTASVDGLQGDTFRRDREATDSAADPLNTGDDGDRAGESRPAVLGRLSAFTLVGEQSGLELGLSATSGTNNVAAKTRTTVFGADVKAKLWNSDRSYLLLQAEALRLDRDDAGWDPDTGRYTHTAVSPWGWYLYGDYNFDLRWNAGVSYERYQQDDAAGAWNSALGVFAGFALMEETTAFRAGWERFDGAGGPAINTYTMRVIYSMGPHKAHQF
jgi:hypothetical protein